MNQANFKVSLRDNTIKANKIRKQGFLPANIFGAGKKSSQIQVDPKAFAKLYDGVGETGLIYLQVDDKKTKTPVLIEDVQYDVLSGEILHVSFKQVDLKDKIKTEIPVVVVGEFDVQNAVLVTVKDAIEVEALPTDFPESFEINAESLTEIGQVITFADLDYDREKVEIMMGEDGEESPVVIVQELKEEVEEEVEEIGDAETVETPANESEKATTPTQEQTAEEKS